MPKVITKRKYTSEEQVHVDRCNKINLMLRRAWSKDPERLKVWKKARRKIKNPTTRHRFEYKCAICKNWFKKEMMGNRCTNLQVDHIVPCGSFLKREHLAVFVDRMFYGELQLLCKLCHQKKSKEERASGAYKREDI